jgi:hypothetical protein
MKKGISNFAIVRNFRQVSRFLQHLDDLALFVTMYFLFLHFICYCDFSSCIFIWKNISIDVFLSPERPTDRQTDHAGRQALGFYD